MNILALATLDYLVMALYAAVVIGIGWVVSRRQKVSEDYFLGGRKLRWWLAGISLMATSFSSIALIGGTGFGFKVGMQMLQWQIGDILALALACLIFLPFFMRLELTTAYEYLEKRFGVVARTFASAMFLGQTLLRTSLLVFGPAVALSAIMGWPVEAAILVAAAAAILYSAFGGISAVVWTDLIQVCVILFGIGSCLFLVGSDLPGGLGEALDHARSMGRTEVVTLSADRSTPFNLLGSLLPYFVLAFSLFGTGQQAIQRFLSVGDVRGARRAAFAGWTAGTVTLGITLFLGACLASWAELSPGAMKIVGNPTDPEVTGNSVLPAFIGGRLPAGLAGLMLAAIFAASMSSVDSAVHSMSTAVIVDFRRRFFQKTPDPRAELKTARIATVLIGAAATGGAVLAARAGTTILETLVTWLAYFAGPLLGLFLLGIFSRRTNEIGAVTGALVGFAGVWICVLFAGRSPFGFHPIWLGTFACAVTLVTGRLASHLGGSPDPGSLVGLVWRRG